MTDYTVEVTREGKAWLADVPELPGVHTWAKNLPSLEESLREAIALAEDLPDGAEQSVGLRFEYHLGDERLDHLTRQPPNSYTTPTSPSATSRSYSPSPPSAPPTTTAPVTSRCGRSGTA